MNYYDGIYCPTSIKILPMTSDEDKPEFANKSILENQEDYFKNHLDACYLLGNASSLQKIVLPEAVLRANI